MQGSFKLSELKAIVDNALSIYGDVPVVGTFSEPEDEAVFPRGVVSYDFYVGHVDQYGQLLEGAGSSDRTVFVVGE